MPGEVAGTPGWETFTSVGAADYSIGPVVNNTDDSGPESLRQRIAETPSGGTIYFDFALSGETITLDSEIVIDGNVVIGSNFLDQDIIIDGGAGNNRIFSVDSDQSLSLSHLTLTGGSGGGALESGNGGAIHNSGVLNLQNCTFTDNTASGNGGGLFLSGTNTTAVLRHCTFIDNIAPQGAAIRLNGGTLTLENSIVAGNSASSSEGPDIHLTSGSVISSGASLIGDNHSIETVYPAGAPNSNGDYVGINTTPLIPLLAPFGDYGGPTQTMPPLPGSPVIDVAVASDLNIDQHSRPRVSGASPDIGVVEAFAFSSLPLEDTDGDGIDDRLEPEFIELGFDDPAPIIAVSIYETFGPGAVSKVSVRDFDTGDWTEVWTGTASPAPEVSRIFTVSFPETAFPVDAVRIDLDSPAVFNWNEIDAVSISR